MLHILWILFKFILILLGILLGLALLAILLILFCPVRYKLILSKDAPDLQNTEIQIRVSWLFHGIFLQFHLVNRHTKTDFRILGIPVRKLKQLFSKKHLYSKSSSYPTADNTKHSETPSPDVYSADKHTTNTSSTDEESTDFKKGQIEEFFFKLGIKCRSVLEHIRSIFQKLKAILSSFEKFTLSLQKFCVKINAYKILLEHPRTQSALPFLKFHLQKLFKHVFPTRLKGKLTFGSTDPSITGTVLAVLGVTIPLHRNRISVNPVFEDANILEGNIRLKGRIYGFVLLNTAAKLYFDPNIKYLIRRLKNKEG